MSISPLGPQGIPSIQSNTSYVNKLTKKEKQLVQLAKNFINLNKHDNTDLYRLKAMSHERKIFGLIAKRGGQGKTTPEKIKKLALKLLSIAYPVKDSRKLSEDKLSSLRRDTDLSSSISESVDDAYSETIDSDKALPLPDTFGPTESTASLDLIGGNFPLETELSILDENQISNQLDRINTNYKRGKTHVPTKILKRFCKIVLPKIKSFSTNFLQKLISNLKFSQSVSKSNDFKIQISLLEKEIEDREYFTDPGIESNSEKLDESKKSSSPFNTAKKSKSSTGKKSGISKKKSPAPSDEAFAQVSATTDQAPLTNDEKREWIQNLHKAKQALIKNKNETDDETIKLRLKKEISNIQEDINQLVTQLGEPSFGSMSQFTQIVQSFQRNGEMGTFASHCCAYNSAVNLQKCFHDGKVTNIDDSLTQGYNLAFDGGAQAYDGSGVCEFALASNAIDLTQGRLSRAPEIEGTWECMGFLAEEGKEAEKFKEVITNAENLWNDQNKLGVFITKNGYTSSLYINTNEAGQKQYIFNDSHGLRVHGVPESFDNAFQVVCDNLDDVVEYLALRNPHKETNTTSELNNPNIVSLEYVIAGET